MLYQIGFDGKEWIAVLGEVRLNRMQMLAKIKAKAKDGFDVENEWAAYALIERRTHEDRWGLASARVLKQTVI